MRLLYVILAVFLVLNSIGQNSFFVKVTEKNLDKEQEFSLVKSNIVKTLNELNFVNVTNEKKAKYKIFVNANTKKGSEYEGIFTTFANANITIANLKNNSEVYTQSYTNIKSGGLNYSHAGDKALKKLSKKLISNLKLELNSDKYKELLQANKPKQNSDNTPPEIAIASPNFINGIKTSTKNSTYLFKIKVTDKNGVANVLINNKSVSQINGIYQTNINLNDGENFVSVVATDKYNNATNSNFIIEKVSENQRNIIENVQLASSSKVIWNSPNYEISEVPFSNFNVDVCIKANDIKKVQLFVNNIVQKEISFQKELAFRGEQCDANINKKIVLIEGKNILKIVLETGSKTIESERIVNYNINSSKYYALIIAAQDYSDDRITDLSNPINDATKLKNILVNNYTFKQENLKFLKNPTKADIIGELHHLRKKITKNDNLFIFYAGHGYWDEEMETGYWLPTDANKDNPVNWMPNTDLTNYLNAIKAKHILLVADACFSGGIFKTRAAFTDVAAVEKLYKMPSRKAITSGTLKEVPDDSVFLKFFLKNLKENTNKYLTAEELFSSIKMAVINNSQNVPQYGTIQNTGDEGGDFIFLKK